MANGTKTYEIKINGIQESVNAVDSLNKQLNDLEQRINTLNSKGITVKQSGGGSALEEQDKLQKQILATEEKLAQVRDENYKKLLHMKEELKEYTQVAKSQVAAEANQQGLFDTSTMLGMKEQLKSIKAEMQTVEIGGDRFNELTQQANELNNKLKEIEQSYGQFGRNVGNYAEGVAQGMSKVKVQVGDTVREFSNAREASRTLSNELKSMAINGEKDTKAFKDMQKAVAKLNSDIKDATVSSRGMDNLLDTMQSFAALGQVGQGLSALFGFDDEEIERSIQKLVALQNVMQGIETINQQINSQEGIGGWLAKGNEAIDSFVSSLTGAAKAQTELNSAMSAGKTVSEGLAAAETAQATATAGATVATRALSVALKALGIGLVISLVATLITYWEDIVEWFQDTIPALKNLDTWFDKIRATAVGVGNAILNYVAGPLVTAANVIKDIINGDFAKAQADMVLGLKKTFSIRANYQKGYHKETERQQDAHNKKMKDKQKKANEEQEKDDEARYGRNHKRTQEYLKKQMALTDKNSEEYRDLQRQLWRDEREEREEEERKKLRQQKNGAKESKKVAENELDFELKLMKDGLNKKLMQLEEEKRQTINKLQENGRATAEALKKVEDAYYQKRHDTIKEYLDNLTNSINESAKKIREIKFSINTGEIDEAVKRVKQEIDYVYQTIPIDNELVMQKDEGIIGKALGYDLGTNFEARLDENKEYLNKYLQQVINFNNDIKALNNERANEERQENLAKANDEYNELRKSLESQRDLANDNAEAVLKNKKDANDKLKEEDQKTYDEFIKDKKKAEDLLTALEQQYTEKKELIEKQYASTIEQIQRDETDSNREIYEKYYNKEISNLRDFLSAVNNEISKQPVVYKGGWNIINVGETKKQYYEIKKAADWTLNSINNELAKLQRDYSNLVVSEETYNATMKQLNDLKNAFTSSFETIEANERNLLSNFQQSINQYIQEGLQAVQTIMDALADYQDYQFDREEEMLDKQNELIENKLSEQADIVEKYKDKVDSIEDELSTARGDRRQHLIDQLNAEIAAQRNAQKEEQKLQKQKDALAKKQEQLDKERKKAEYKRNLMNILISTAMATANGLATQPFVPVGIAMGALATSLGMVQYALAAKQKPYAKGGQLDGGVAVGARHRDGGIKVLGGRAEIEGGEYITNRLTTAKNIDLLSYINSKKKRIDISDMIDFYNSGKVRTSIKNVRSKFEDGGYIPTLPASLDISDQLQNIVINQDNRPIVVSVVDINNKQEDVRRVQALAGL